MNQIARHSETILTTGQENHLLPHLIKAIESASEIEISVSFLKTSGLNLIADSLFKALNENKAKISILTSDYLDITCPVALRQLIYLKDNGARIKIYQTSENEQNISFHMKAYIFTTSQNFQIEDGTAFIGSNNLSKMALTKGLEWCLRFDLDKNSNISRQNFEQIRQSFSAIFNDKHSIDLSHQWIDQYISRRKQPLLRKLDLDDEFTTPECEPHEIQITALQNLNTTRQNGQKAGLVVLATGMGKTYLAAFDVKAVDAKKILFVAHREEILVQAQKTFSSVLKMSTGLYNGKYQEKDADCIFASIQTINKAKHLNAFSRNHFDYIIIDEFHHADALTYRNLISYFEPKFLLGLTATPDRTDQADIYTLCANNLVFERNFIQGIEDKILSPFQYYGIWDDEVNYEEIPWRNGKFDINALESKFATEKRSQNILNQWKMHKQSRTLAFCISVKHADWMSEYFTRHGFKSISVHSESTTKRNEALQMLENRDIDIIFSVDLFNEGTDIPSIDTILLLRPTESKILFLQQLGRGLRKFENKSHLVVLDFIGNHKSFLNRPTTLLMESQANNIIKTLENKNNTLPEGCFVNFDLKVIDLFKKFASSQKTSALDDYRTLKDKLQRSPTVCEFYLEYNTLEKIKNWFDFLITNNLESQSEDSATIKKHLELLSEIQNTPLTKSFKIITLKAFIDLNGFIAPPTTKLLSEKSWQILQLYPDILKEDLPPEFKDVNYSPKNWLSYWKKNPIKAIAGSESQSKKWFSITKNENIEYFTANFSIDSSEAGILNTCISDLIDLLLTKYTDRIRKRILEKKINEPSMPDNIISLPFFENIKIACGHFKEGHELDVKTLEIANIKKRGNLTNFFLAKADGNSMDGGKNPIKNGQLLLLEKITPSNAGSINGHTIALEQQDETGINKYLLRDAKKISDGEYELIAKNLDYHTIKSNESMIPFARLHQIIDEKDIIKESN